MPPAARKRKISSEANTTKRKKQDTLENVTKRKCQKNLYFRIYESNGFEHRKRIKTNEAQRRSKGAKQIQTFDLHETIDVAATEPSAKKNDHAARTTVEASKAKPKTVSETKEPSKPLLLDIKQEPVFIISDDDDDPPAAPKKKDIPQKAIIACINKAILDERKFPKASTLEERRNNSKDDESSKKTMQYRNEFHNFY